MVANPPPSKKEQLNKLLERGSVFVHLDPRREGVAVPAWLTKKPQLVLQLGLNFPIPIRDLEIDDAGVRCTLSFNRAPFYCVLPWSAVYALVAEDGQVTVWPSDLPSELVPQVEPAIRRGAPRDKQHKRPRISVVPPPPDAASPAPVPQLALDASSTPPAPPEADRRDVAAGDGGGDAARSEGGEDAPRSPQAPASQRPARERPPYLRLIK